MRYKNTIWDYIFLVRPILLIPVWAFFLIGYLKAGGERFSFSKIFVHTAIAYTSLISILYILNQIADRKTDAINQKHLLIAEKIISLRSAFITILVLLLITIIFSFKLPVTSIILMVFSFFSGIFYSFPPLKLKAVPFLDFLINGTGYGILNFSLGWVTTNHFSIQTIIASIPYFFAVSAIFVNTTILDVDGDKNCGYITTGVLLGKKNSARLGLLLITLCIISSFIVKDYLCLIPAVISFPLFLAAGIQGDEKFIKLSIRIGGPLLILVVGIIFPHFLFIVLSIFLFLRIYYKNRFGINYPSL
ncbi:MAG: UbiA family prenyltransferase [candidate division WOR-3 bacterium]|nr:UbiA family prenyltransferase [candidate division WOR-3 bacterium]